MAAPVISIADDLVTKLAVATGYTFERRSAPYLSREDVVGGKWFVVPAGDEQVIKARNVDRSTLTIDVAYQEPLPEKSDAYPDPIENLVWFDAVMAKVEDVKNLFRGNGDLRDTRFATHFDFFTMTNTPIYRPDLMTDYQIFTAVIRLEFVGEIEAV